MTTQTKADQWLEMLASNEARGFFGRLIELLAEREIFPEPTEAGHLGIPITREWNGKHIRVLLSDTYPAHRTYNYPTDTLRLGYEQHTPNEIRSALDPWIDLLHERFHGESRRSISRYEEWSIPNEHFSALNIASEIEIAARIIRSVPDITE